MIRFEQTELDISFVSRDKMQETAVTLTSSLQFAHVFDAYEKLITCKVSIKF